MLRSFFFLPVAFLLVLCACSGENANRTVTQLVEGVALLDGNPISGASIQFIPKDSEGELAAGSSDKQGKFVMNSILGIPGQGAKTGEYLVTVSQREVTLIPSKTGNSEDDRTEFKELLPRIYQDEKKSPLNVTVRKGKNFITLELTKKP